MWQVVRNDSNNGTAAHQQSAMYTVSNHYLQGCGVPSYGCNKEMLKATVEKAPGEQGAPAERGACVGWYSAAG